MKSVEISINEKGRGAFYITAEGKRIGEMEVAVSDGRLIVYHTEVAPEMEGKGVAKQLLTAMVEHARNHGLKVMPLCPYVNAQFRRHPAAYKDVWYK